MLINLSLIQVAISLWPETKGSQPPKVNPPPPDSAEKQANTFILSANALF
ncbi:Uncharacterized protein YR821_2235 [Yersinia ruckeri]|uniref:Uncharacterized protein n=1 Tax=Yersinia ruckeri TaxID=29486 RepID=A0A0A8VE25_YERRU|nr:hypothetical protein yruck0001_33330 [Yersinia ruckeri ATCC 29473]QTD77154.1 Uncharacterized protein YR821_2235 [Yersinia ruckeri]CEK28037.1 hypothetical protein CSF007_11465 [Yersinia ruckeri]